MSRTIRTACPYCGVGCGVRATPDGRGGATIDGDPDHPANFGRLCSKGTALGETVSLEGRLLAPRIDGRDAEWNAAIGLVADRFRRAIAEHGPESVAFYVSGQLLTEDYYVFNKLMKGFIGAANIDTNSRLCMASSVAAHRRAFGTDTVPGTYEDLEEADLLVLVGSNLAWCHPVLFQRVAAAKARRPGMRIVTVDPRRTATSELADLELRLAPGSDIDLFNGLLARIAAEGAVDTEFVRAHVSGFDETLARAADARPGSATGLGKATLEQFYEHWIGTEKTVTLFSQGVNQSSSGTDKANAIINAHLATGRIGRPGMGPFSVTGQPNAMGGREVGGLANMLAVHLNIEDRAHRASVQSFWDAPTIASRPGLKAVDLFRACSEGRIKALWIAATNPAVSMPRADAVADAIRACPFVVVSDVMAQTDTVALADVALPAAAWGEKSGTVTNSERRITRQRAFLPLPGVARPDWRIVCDIAAAMGWGGAFDYRSEVEIFREHAALSAVAGRLGRDFDIGGLAEMDQCAYDALPPTQWPVKSRQQWADRDGRPGGRFFADGGFFTPDRRGRMVPVRAPAPATPRAEHSAFRLNTGRVRDHWHTMTRTAKSARLSRHMAEPFLEMNPADARRLGLAAADLVRVESPHGSAILRLLVTERVGRGALFAPIHWTSDWAARARIDVLVEAATDPISGQPDLKGTTVRVSRLSPAWHGYALSRRELRPDTLYWARARVAGGWQAELADTDTPADWAETLRHMLVGCCGEVVSVSDTASGTSRLALVSGGRVDAILFASPGPVELARAHLTACLAADRFDLALLAGRPGADIEDAGALVCGCFGVGANTILNTAAERGISDIQGIGRVLAAGTNCGSCRPEIAAILATLERRVAAE